MKSKAGTVKALGLSSLLHLIGLFLILSFFEPFGSKSPESAISIFISDVYVPLKKKVIDRKQVLSTHSPLIHRQSIEPTVSIQQPVLLPTTTQEIGVYSITDETEVHWDQILMDSPGQEFGIRTGKLGDMVVSVLPTTLAEHTHSFVGRPYRQSLAILHGTRAEQSKSYALKANLTAGVVRNGHDEYLSNRIAHDFDKIDVVFIISCRGAMRTYVDYAIALIEREIQEYKGVEKDYHIGIIKSRFLGLDRPVHQIEYSGLISDLDRVVEIVRETRKLKFFPRDIFLNTIRYALDRVAFRPGAFRKIIAIGNDIPICGGYSPLSIIELCQRKQVVLEIYGADCLIGPLLARETGGEWFAALENPRDSEVLQSIHIGSQHWKVEYTIDTVLECKFTDWSSDR